MSENLHAKHVRQIEQITESLRKIKLLLGLLGDMQGLSAEQKSAVESLTRGLDFVRGGELGQARQAFGLDQDIRIRNQTL